MDRSCSTISVATKIQNPVSTIYKLNLLTSFRASFMNLLGARRFDNSPWGVSQLAKPRYCPAFQSRSPCPAFAHSTNLPKVATKATSAIFNTQMMEVSEEGDRHVEVVEEHQLLDQVAVHRAHLRFRTKAVRNTRRLHLACVTIIGHPDSAIKALGADTNTNVTLLRLWPLRKRCQRLTRLPLI